MTKKLTFSLLLSILSLGLLSQQPDFITEKYFPDPDIRFNTPTLSIEEERFATYDEIIKWIEDSIAVHPYSRVEIIGTTPLGREVPVIYLSNGSSAGKLRVWMQGLLHGNEPAGGEALLYLAKRILTTGKGSEYLENMEIAILPIANVDGFVAMNRRSAGGYDLNRDQTKFADPVSKMIKKAFIDWQSDIAFDFHEFQPTRMEFSGIGTKGASTAYDVLFLPSGYLNIPEGLRKASSDIFQREAELALDEHGYTHNFYFTANVSGDEMILNKGAQSPHSSSTSYALSNSISLLVETRGIGLGRTSFPRRTHSSFIVASSFLESALRHKDEIQGIVAGAREATIAATEEIAVLNEPLIYNTGVNFIDLSNGELITLDLRIRDAENLTPTLTRPRPEGYILEGSCRREAEILSLLGLEVKQTAKRKRYWVESFVIRKYEEADAEWEKINTVDATADLINQKRVFPKGSYYVDLHQKNANYAISVLEPESLNGFVTYKVSPTSGGDTLRVHRVVKKLKTKY